MRKAGKPDITPEIMTKVWNLYAKIDDMNLIGETLGISARSAQRIVIIMTAAKNGEDVDAVEGNGHRKQKEFAKKFFGIEEKKEETTKEEQSAVEDDSAIILLKAHSALERQNKLLEKQNELLERLCSAWGV